MVRGLTTAGLAVLLAALVLLDVPGPVLVPAGLLLCLVLPGYATAGLLRVAVLRTGSVWRTGCVVVLGSLVITIVLGLGLDVVARLDRTSWAVALGAVTVVLALAGTIRPAPAGRPFRLAVPHPLTALSVAGVVVLLAAALVISVRSGHEHEPRFVAAYLDSPTTPTQLVLENHGSDRVGFRLVFSNGVIAVGEIDADATVRRPLPTDWGRVVVYTGRPETLLTTLVSPDS